MTNTLYYGDNLEILRRYIADESVDLIYLDPPFNSNQSYNVLFAEHDGTKAASQVQAFEDTWEWDESAARAYHEVVEAGGQVSLALQAFRTMLGLSNMLAYLAMMAPRLIELRRVLKPAGSIYLHCDPTASHYLKLLMDAVFGPFNFRNEIIWKRKAGRGETNRAARRFGVSTDSILFFARSSAAQFNRQYRESNPAYIASKFVHRDPNGRRYRLDNLTSPSPRHKLFYEYKGHWPPPNGWAVSPETMQEMDREGRLHIPDNPEKRIQRKRYLDELEGETVDSLWDDIPPINSQAWERLGYPTQKPEALLERILSASSHEGDVVLDPFCGCGTAIATAQKMNRRWIGIDITHLAINLVRHRLQNAFGPSLAFEVTGEPKDLSGAAQLAASEPYQFQWWALGLVGARPAEQRKGADQGIDGRLFFHDEGGGHTKQIIFSVKAGKTGVAQVRDLVGVLDREKAVIGVLLSMQEPTREMRKEAAAAGFYASPWGTGHPRVQLLTIAELLAGKPVDYPPTRANLTLKKAPRAEGPGNEQVRLFGD